MKRRLFLLSLAPALAACGSDLTPVLQTGSALAAARAGDLRISSVTVTTTGTAFGTFLAQGFATRLGPDLRAALESGFADRISPAGLPLVVQVGRLDVAGAATTALGEGRSTLSGTVRVIAANGQTFATAEVAATGGSGGELVTGAILGARVTPDAIYDRLIAEFVAETREAVLGREGIGLRILREMTN